MRRPMNEKNGAIRKGSKVRELHREKSQRPVTHDYTLLSRSQWEKNFYRANLLKEKCLFLV